MIYVRVLFKESTHDRALSVWGACLAPMTAYEIISIFIGILALLMSFGSLIIALLAFLDKEKSSSRKSRRKNKMPILSANRIGGVRKDISLA